MDKGQAAGGFFSPFLERQRIQKVSKFIKTDSTILDIGCGRAKLLTDLLAQGKTVSYTGIDILNSILEANRSSFPNHSFYNSNVNSEQLPLELKDKYDYITLIALIEHIENAEQLLKHLSEKLNNNGAIIITTPRRGFEWVHNLGAKIGLFNQDAAEEHNEVFPNKKSIAQLASRSGLKLVTFSYFLGGANQFAVLKKEE